MVLNCSVRTLFLLFSASFHGRRNILNADFYKYFVPLVLLISSGQCPILIYGDLTWLLIFSVFYFLVTNDTFLLFYKLHASFQYNFGTSPSKVISSQI